MTDANLTIDTVVPYLIDRRLVGVDAIVEGDLEVIDAGRRNQNLKVVRRGGPSYLIKQPGEGEFGTLATLRTEAAFYRHCHDELGMDEMRRILPRLHACDAERGTLTLELIDGRPLWGRHGSAPTPAFLAESAGPLGNAVATLHRVFRDIESRAVPWLAGMYAGPPWILAVHRPTPQVLASLSPANLRLIKVLQQNAAMAAELDRLRREWAPHTLIHNDLKGDNILVSKNSEGALHVRIVDWELVQIGDAAWDVGAMFRDFLGYWLLSVPLTSDLSPEEMLEQCSWPLSNLHPAARAFWLSYRAASQLDSTDADDLLIRSLRCAAARLAQGGYELSLTLQELPNLAMAMLQLAANILRDPEAASLHLFGIPAPWRRSTHATSGN